MLSARSHDSLGHACSEHVVYVVPLPALLTPPSAPRRFRVAPRMMTGQIRHYSVTYFSPLGLDRAHGAHASCLAEMGKKHLRVMVHHAGLPSRLLSWRPSPLLGIQRREAAFGLAGWLVSWLASLVRTLAYLCTRATRH